MTFDPSEFGSTVGKLVVGVLTGGGVAYSIFVAWWRKNRVDGVKADVDVGQLNAYNSTIQGLQGDIERLRKTMLDADTKWRQDMADLETRLKAMSDQVDAAIARARTAEEQNAKLRYQLRMLGQEPVV